MGSKSKEQYNTWKREGICVRCGKNPQFNNKFSCQSCQNKDRERGQKRKQENLCYCCGKPNEDPKFTNCSKCKIYNSTFVKQQFKENKDIVYEAYGAFCTCCKEDRIEFLQLDHVNNDGGEHRKTLMSGKDIYRWAIENNFPASLQILCANCNWGKRLTGVCPHKEGCCKPATLLITETDYSYE